MPPVVLETTFYLKVRVFFPLALSRRKINEFQFFSNLRRDVDVRPCRAAGNLDPVGEGGGGGLRPAAAAVLRDMLVLRLQYKSTSSKGAFREGVMPAWQGYIYHGKVNIGKPQKKFFF